MSELDKMQTVQEESHSIGQFLEWLDEQGVMLCKYDDANNRYRPTTKSTEQLLADYFKIDLVKAEKERIVIFLSKFKA